MLDLGLCVTVNSHDPAYFGALRSSLQRRSKSYWTSWMAISHRFPDKTAQEEEDKDL